MALLKSNGGIFNTPDWQKNVTIANTQQTGTLIKAADIPSSNNNSDDTRTISYSDTVKAKAKSMGAAGSYYLWQDDPNATGSAAWMENELKKKGVDLSSKSNTGNGVADFFIEAGKGIIEMPISLKRTLAAGSLGAVALANTPANKAAKILQEGTVKSVSSTIESAKDNPGRFTGAVVAGMLTTKGAGTVLRAVPKPKITTSKTASTKTHTVSLTSKNKVASISVSRVGTAKSGTKTTSAGVVNIKTGSRKGVTIAKTTHSASNSRMVSNNKGRQITIGTEKNGKLKALQAEKVKETRKIYKQTDGISKSGIFRTATVTTNKRRHTGLKTLKLNKTTNTSSSKIRTSDRHTKSKNEIIADEWKDHITIISKSGRESTKIKQTKNNDTITKIRESGKNKEKSELITDINLRPTQNRLPGGIKKTSDTKTVTKDKQLYIMGNEPGIGKTTTSKKGNTYNKKTNAKTKTQHVRTSDKGKIKPGIITRTRKYNTVKSLEASKKQGEKSKTKTSGQTQTQRAKIKPDIVGRAVSDENGKIRRVITKRYRSGVLKTNRDINKGKISKSDREFLKNRRHNKLDRSGDAEALYNRRKSLETSKKQGEKSKTKTSGQTQTQRAKNHDSIEVRGTIKHQSNTQTGVSSHSSSNGMMYQTKTKTSGQTKQKSTQTHRTANILSGETAKTSTKSNAGYISGAVKGAVAGTKLKQVTKSKPDVKPAENIVKLNVYTETSGNSSTTKTKNKTSNRRKSKTGTKAAVATALTQARLRTTATKQQQTPKKKSLLKTAQKQKNKPKRRLRNTEYEKKKMKKIRSKKSKGYLRSETRNNLSWITDNTRLMKEQKIKN